jgi:molecular chaperone DnaJ
MAVLRAFLADFPDGAHAGDAESELAALRLADEERGFAIAKKAGTIEAIDKFLTTYPESNLAPAARSIRDNLISRSRPAGFAADFGSAFSDLFKGIFGMAGTRGRSGSERGADLSYSMKISLEEAFAGKAAQVRTQTSVACESCSGTGAKGGAKPKACPTCGGTGRLRHAQSFFTLERTCPRCQGRGQVIDNPCQTCSGSGRVTCERTVSVNIPAGVEDGTRIRLAGEGAAGLRGGPAGDLNILLSIAPHAFFQRDGADLHCQVHVSTAMAELGGWTEVPMIDGGKTRMKIPAGTESGARLRLQGKGMPILRANRTGDMYVQLMIETSEKPTTPRAEV